MRKTRGALSAWAQKQAKIIGAVVAGVIVGGAGVALASIPDSNGVIRACYTSTGPGAKVRIIDDSTQTCSTNETAIFWNQTGPQGPEGPPGSGSVLIDNLVGADLRGAVMVGWQGLTGLDFSGANLSDSRIGSDVSNSNFSNVNFSQSKLYGSTVAGATFTGANFFFVDASGVDFSGLNMQNMVRFAGTMTNANFQNADLTNSTFSSVTGGNFSGANFTDTDFLGGAFRDTNLSGVNLTGATMLTQPGSGGQLDFRNVNFTNANFTNAQFTNDTNLSIEFFNTNLTGSDMSALDVSRVVWHSDTICPDGTNSGANGNTCVGHLSP